MRARTLALVVAFVLPMAFQATAGPFEDGQSAAERADYAATLKYWKSGADAGDARAQYGLGAIYGEGRGVPQDYGEAAKWYRLAVAQDYGPAQVNLGVLLENGLGVARDEREAARLYGLAAANGIPVAQNNLGVLNEAGRGVAQDHKEAARLYRLAAEKGIGAAQANLGRMYGQGLGGLPQDFEEAVKWLALASAQGSEEGQTSLGEISSDGVKAYNRGDYAAALKVWLPLAQHGHPRSRYRIGTMYEKGEGVFRSLTQAADWYRMAAEQGDTTAQFNIGALLSRGDGVPQNRVQAFKWMTLARSGKTDLRIPEAAARALRNLAARMTQDQIATANSLAQMWRPQPGLTIRSSVPDD